MPPPDALRTACVARQPVCAPGEWGVGGGGPRSPEPATQTTHPTGGGIPPRVMLEDGWSCWLNLYHAPDNLVMPGNPEGAAAQQFATAQPTQMHKPTTPEEMVGQAQTIAQQMMSLPSSQRRSELITLKRVDPTMHSLVTSAMDEIRQQARSMGQQQMLSQQYGQM